MMFIQNRDHIALLKFKHISRVSWLEFVERGDGLYLLGLGFFKDGDELFESGSLGRLMFPALE